MAVKNLVLSGVFTALVSVCGSCGSDEVGAGFGEPGDPATDGSATAAEPFPNGRGPTGRWPDGFPAYSTSPEITTDGSSSSLLSAITDAACSDGCLIEHAGNIGTGFIRNRAGSGEIVVRPPIGQRADFAVTDCVIEVSNLLIAGYSNASNLAVGNNGINSGYAWSEDDGSGGGGPYIWANGNPAYGIFYEIVQTGMGSTAMYDRGGTRVQNIADSEVTLFIVGSYITGARAPEGHTDTLQTSGGVMEIRDSIVWSSYEKAIQPVGNNPDVFIYNSFIVGPGDTNYYWDTTQGGGIWGCAYRVIGSTILGPGYWCNDGAGSPTQDSELWNPSTYIDLGGNTILGSRPAFPAPPTHEQLDVIWSP